ncbi:nuclease-like protein [Staphylococcus epidermidis]|nr:MULTISPECIES: nuclease-related domain-containing protein [Staphylococcus]HCY6687770.1 NERD domain-containing protein [Staphylococcus aureus]KAB2209943.1 NERD domain-containing protein [Staphylococcus epidermidis]KAB2277393.1 NERD domain-containing protein [Staphylococcus epidermidis]MBC2967098.1 NERD domain-containing protein [Staphylococcus epidermidis]MBC2971431.1 NERD domain-containing protein [Staphylococcus epidermidis]
MIIALLLCSIILFCLVIYFYKKSIDNIKLKEENEQALILNIDRHKSQNKDLSVRYNKLTQKYEDVCKENQNLKESYRSGHIFDKNIGEIKAAKELQEIFEQLKEEVNLNYFIKFDNLFLYDLNEPRQIDHMVICDYGIYIFETKYWEGDIYYNISKESLRGTKHKLLNRYIFYKQDENEHQTFVLKLNENGEITYQNNGNPYKQIYKTMKILNDFLDKKYFINSIIYFNYHNDKYHFIDGSDKNNGIIGVNQKENLYNVLKNRMKNFKFGKLKEKQIKYLKQKFEKYNV